VKFPTLGIFVALAVTAVAASAAPATAPAAAPAATTSPKLSKWQQLQLEQFKDSAPADEYFGKMKMSYLGMNNTFRDSAISSGDHTTDPAIINKVALAEDALEKWGAKYPHDPQLARTYFLAVQVERKIWVKANQERAWIYFNRLVQRFPDSYFGKTLKRDLAIGFTEHYYAVAVACATPTPSPSPSEGSTNDTSTATPSPSPTATPSPGPTETTLAKNLHAEILPQPCIPPPTPTPSPTPTATPSSTPSATPAATEPSPAAS
jgi:hypothetical protein